MKAFLIAAGTGTRLYPITKDIPKSLVEVGQGLTLLETQLHSLKEAGIRDVVLIIGYRAPQIEAKVAEYGNDFNFQVVYNPFYESSNNLVSVWLARHLFTEEFITINGDDLFNSKLLKDLMAAPHDITMVVDSKPTYDDDDMKVVLEDDRVTHVGKDLDLNQANGESVGIIKFKGAGVSTYQATLEAMVREPKNLNAFYLKALQQIMDSGVPVHFSRCEPTDWGEIDFHPDLEIIRQHVLRSNLVDQVLGDLS